mgnify:CR=1 FL=1
MKELTMDNGDVRDVETDDDEEDDETEEETDV